MLQKRVFRERADLRMGDLLVQVEQADRRAR